MTPEERKEAAAAWRKLKADDPEMAEELDPLIREFGMSSLLYVRFASPVPQVHGHSKHHRTLEYLVAAFLDEAERLVKLYRGDEVMADEARCWW